MHEHLPERQRSVRSANRALDVISRPVDLLTPDPANARVHTKKQIRQIADSIRIFGFNVPILVDADLV